MGKLMFYFWKLIEEICLRRVCQTEEIVWRNRGTRERIADPQATLILPTRKELCGGIVARDWSGKIQECLRKIRMSFSLESPDTLILSSEKLQHLRQEETIRENEACLDDNKRIEDDSIEDLKK